MVKLKLLLLTDPSVLGLERLSNPGIMDLAGMPNSC